MKKRNLENGNLESEVNNLIDKIESLGGNINNLPISYDEYSMFKNHYKKNKKYNNKIKTVRNLKITGNVIRLSIPFVLAIGIGIGGIVVACNGTADYENEYNQYNIVTMDNSGEVSEKLVKTELEDYIEIETRWFEENGVYVQYRYKTNHDFETKEQMEEIINSDSFELMKKYNFSQEEKLVMEETDDREVDPNAKDKITVAAGVKCGKEEFEELTKSSLIFAKVGCSVLTCVTGAMVGFLYYLGRLLVFNADNEELLGNIRYAKGTAEGKLLDEKTLKNDKKKIKEIKKKLK